jgi:hypothetical protein
MSLVNDLSMIQGQINDFNFLTVAAITTSDYPNHPNIYNASILMPPTEVLMAWAEGQPLVMQNEYPRYLLSTDPDNMIVALIAAMTKKNIVLYIPQDEFNIYGNILLNHLYYVYGITCNYMQTQFSVNQAKIPYIISKFYAIDVMSYDDYMAMYPANALLPEFVIQKMAREVPSLGGPASFQEYANYFNAINASKANNVKQTMVNIVRPTQDDSIHS